MGFESDAKKKKKKIKVERKVNAHLFYSIEINKVSRREKRICDAMAGLSVV